MRRFLLLALLLPLHLLAQNDIVGRWVTIDDNTHKQRSVVEISIHDGKAYGKIIKLFREPGEDPDPICDKCDAKDDRRNKKVVGLEIIRDMVRDDDKWNDGTILDPENGSVYDCKLWVEDGQLKVRGYLLFFYRTQTWVPENPGQPKY